MRTTTLTADSTHEQIVREYFQAFTSQDITKVLELLHPAIFFQRSVHGKQEVSICGRDEFRDFVIQHVTTFDEHSLKISQFLQGQDKDRVEAIFSIVEHHSDHTDWQISGRAIFWFSEELILQLSVLII